MADPLQLLERDYRETSAGLDLADHNRTWAMTFQNTPPSEVLRANNNYDNLLATAIERKQQIGALTDKKQQELYYNSRLQPLKEDLLRGQISHQAASTIAAGATTRFHQAQDTETMGHIVGFADHMEKAPPVDSPQYAPYVLHGVQKFPRMATTAWGKETLGKLAAEHDTIQSLKAQIPPGFEMQTVEIGGGKQSHVTARKIGGDDSKSLRKDYQITPEQFASPVSVAVVKPNPDKTKAPSEPFVGANDGNYVHVTVLGSDGQPKSAVMPRADYLKYGGKLSEQDSPASSPIAPTTTPNISKDAYDQLKPGEPYHWNGKQLTKK